MPAHILADNTAAPLPGCSAPDDLTNFDVALPKLKRQITSGQPVRIVALGSSSTAGTGASSKDKRYPRQLAQLLAERLADHDITVENHGKGGALATHMLLRIKTSILPKMPTLVIWQTGVNDAIRRVPLNDFRNTLHEGISILQKRKIDVVLIDPQYFTNAHKHPDYGRYIAAMAEIGRSRNVPVLKRYALMQHLVSSSQFELDELLAKDRFHLNDVSYRCLSTVLADALHRTLQFK